VVVSPQSLANRRADWVKFVGVWDKVVKYLNDPKTRDDGIKIIAARAGVDPKEYAVFMPGTQFLTLAEGGKVLSAKSEGFDSLVGSSKIANEFNVTNAVYKDSQDVTTYIDASLTLEVLKKK